MNELRRFVANDELTGTMLVELARAFEAVRPDRVRIATAYFTPDGFREIQPGLEQAGDVRILDDTYNANPVSLRAALETAAAGRAGAGGSHGFSKGRTQAARYLSYSPSTRSGAPCQFHHNSGST